MAYKAIELAKYIVTKCAEEFNAISNLQLQKILYFIQGEYYRTFGEFIIEDDFEAWQYGPVIPAVYDGYKCNYSAPIYPAKDEQVNLIELSPEETEIVHRVIDIRAFQNVYQLVNDSHKVDGAWDRTYKKGTGNGNVIHKKLIQQDFISN